MVDGDITGGDRARSLLVQGQGGLVAVMHAQRNLFQVEQDIDDVFLHALYGGVLMQHAIDLGIDNGRARHRREQDATQCVAKRVAKTALQRLQGYLGVTVVNGLHIHDARLEELVDVSEHERVPQLLLGIQFDNQIFVDVGRQFTAFRARLVHALHFLGIDVEPVGDAALLCEIHGRLDTNLRTGLLVDTDHVVWLHLIGRDVDPLAVDQDMTMVDELARGEHRGHELGAVDHRVQAPLQELDQVLAGIAPTPGGLVIVAAELLLADIAVVALELLLGGKLRAEVRRLAAALAMLSGAVLASVKGAFRPAPKVAAEPAVNLLF